MKKIFFTGLMLVITTMIVAQTAVVKPEILYGPITRENLARFPYTKWFDSMYAAYIPARETVTDLKKQHTRGLRFEIFLGTWCGDSRREVPRFLKILDQLPMAEHKVSLIALGNSDSLVKQSPGHEEAGKGIFRVPVFIVYRDGNEIGRITEFPVNSLENDLLRILSAEGYQPNYRSFGLIQSWLSNGTLLDKNMNTRGLALQLKQWVAGEYELNSLGYLLKQQGLKKEALRLFQFNAIIYPESANCQASLAEGFLENGENKTAVQYFEKALELNKDPQKVKPILELLYKAKAIPVLPH